MGVEDEVCGQWERQWIGTKALVKAEYSFQSEQSDPLNSITLERNPGN